jgi:hypothetical protein
MSFIVEVTRRKADDPELSFNNLEMFHQNCFGGKIVYYTREGMRDHQQCLKCERCDSGVIVDRDKLWDWKKEIILTAIDGKKREIPRRWEKQIIILQK